MSVDGPLGCARACCELLFATPPTMAAQARDVTIRTRVICTISSIALGGEGWGLGREVGDYWFLIRRKRLRLRYISRKRKATKAYTKMNIY